MFAAIKKKFYVCTWRIGPP